VPEGVDYGWRPYTLGQWSWVEPHGWTWVSQEPWGWATYHYGRWAYVDDYGWVWVPGTTWGPAWVAFRYGDPYVGWAPLARCRLPLRLRLRPDRLNAEVRIGAFAWSFVQRYFAESTSDRTSRPGHSRRMLERPVGRPAMPRSTVGTRTCVDVG
jgi:hypothetical protein